MPQHHAVAPAPATNARGALLLTPGLGLRTQSGRPITVPALTGRLPARLAQIDAWLLAEARVEASLAPQTISPSALQGLEAARLSPSDRDTLNDILFGDERGARRAHLR